jgi:hypothetical protein
LKFVGFAANFPQQVPDFDRSIRRFYRKFGIFRVKPEIFAVQNGVRAIQFRVFDG